MLFRLLASLGRYRYGELASKSSIPVSRNGREVCPRPFSSVLVRSISSHSSFMLEEKDIHPNMRIIIRDILSFEFGSFEWLSEPL